MGHRFSKTAENAGCYATTTNTKSPVESTAATMSMTTNSPVLSLRLSESQIMHKLSAVEIKGQCACTPAINRIADSESMTTKCLSKEKLNMFNADLHGVDENVEDPLCNNRNKFAQTNNKYLRLSEDSVIPTQKIIITIHLKKIEIREPKIIKLDDRVLGKGNSFDRDNLLHSACEYELTKQSNLLSYRKIPHSTRIRRRRNAITVHPCNDSLSILLNSLLLRSVSPLLRRKFCRKGATKKKHKSSDGVKQKSSCENTALQVINEPEIFKYIRERIEENFSNIFVMNYERLMLISTVNGDLHIVFDGEKDINNCTKQIDSKLIEIHSLRDVDSTVQFLKSEGNCTEESIACFCSKLNSILRTNKLILLNHKEIMAIFTTRRNLKYKDDNSELEEHVDMNPTLLSTVIHHSDNSKMLSQHTPSTQPVVSSVIQSSINASKKMFIADQNEMVPDDIISHSSCFTSTRKCLNTDKLLLENSSSSKNIATESGTRSKTPPHLYPPMCSLCTLKKSDMSLTDHAVSKTDGFSIEADSGHMEIICNNIALPEYVVMKTDVVKQNDNIHNSVKEGNDTISTICINPEPITKSVNDDMFVDRETINQHIEKDPCVQDTEAHNMTFTPIKATDKATMNTFSGISNVLKSNKLASNVESLPVVHSQVDFSHYLVPDLHRIINSTFYWGKMDRYEAERLLDGKPEGCFLLRDSAQEEFLFSVTFRKFGRSLHARIEQSGHRFSFDCHDPSVYTSPTIIGLLEHYKDPACVMFFEPMLTIPLHRRTCFSLQQLCRATIVSNITYDGVNMLELPGRIKSYLKEYHYKQKLRVKPFDDNFNHHCV